MTPLVTEFFKLFAREVATVVVEHLNANTSAGDENGEADKTPAPVVTVAQTPEELRADCLAIINLLAPTHGKQLRAILATFEAKRLGEVKDESLSVLLAGLEALKNA